MEIISEKQAGFCYWSALHLWMLDCHIVEGTVNADRFEEFVEKSLLPHLCPFNGINLQSVVVMDNCSIHHVERVVELIESTGALVIFLPPYSPDFNPVEEAFAKVKAYLKANEMVVQATDITEMVHADGIRYYHTGGLFRVDRTPWLLKHSHVHGNLHISLYSITQLC